MPVQLIKIIIVKGSIDDIFHLWANFENFPHFMKNIKAVDILGPKKSRWVVEGPLGKDLYWDAQITDLQENKRIAWNTTDGQIKTSGQVTFNQLKDNETEVMVSFQYVAPAGKLGEAASHILDNPEKKLEEDLRNFKKYAEKERTKSVV